ncbi:hypothetical protein EYF80_015583 [Liparis tanakae]|uniref:Transferrin-like domain-containing protein n=1 Tax=Liparis tanakae TaxID=230148 RepID=A0A4Z2I864_9TELE|nr:hypothetical protein EYF80_015583 [Liparis tanakae]
MNCRLQDPAHRGAGRDGGRNSLKMPLSFLFSSSFANPSYHAVSLTSARCVLRLTFTANHLSPSPRIKPQTRHRSFSKTTRTEIGQLGPLELVLPTYGGLTPETLSYDHGPQLFHLCLLRGPVSREADNGSPWGRRAHPSTAPESALGTKRAAELLDRSPPSRLLGHSTDAPPQFHFKSAPTGLTAAPTPPPTHLYVEAYSFRSPAFQSTAILLKDNLTAVIKRTLDENRGESARGEFSICTAPGAACDLMRRDGSEVSRQEQSLGAERPTRLPIKLCVPPTVELALCQN